MPTTAKLLKPKSEDEFEDMCVDFLRIRWNDPHAVRNGRRGQRQDGVDIVGHPPRLNGRTAGAQCKNTDGLKLGDVVAEVKKAKSFEGGLGEFLMITSSDRDAPLQAEVRKYFKAKPAPFRVEVIFWDDIIADLAQDERLVAKHWKGFPPALSLAEVIRFVKPLFESQFPLFEAQFSRLLKMYLPIVVGNKKATIIPRSVQRRHSSDTHNATAKAQSRKSTPLSESTRLSAARAALALISESKLSLSSARLRKRVVAALSILRPGESEYGSITDEKLLAGQLRAYHALMLTCEGQLDAAEVELDTSRLLLGRGLPREGAALVMMARQHFKANQLTRAEGLSREAIAIFRRWGNEPIMISNCLSDLGAIARGQNHPAEAASHFEEACAVEETLGRKERSAALSFESGRLRMIMGEYSKAIPLLEAAVRWHGELGDDNALGWSLTILAVALHKNNDPAAAHERAEAARTLGLKLSDDVLFQAAPRKKRGKS